MAWKHAEMWGGGSDRRLGVSMISGDAATRHGRRPTLCHASLFDLVHAPHERGNLARKRPALPDEWRGLWEAWNQEMPPVPEHLTPPMSNLAEMLW